MEVQSTSHLPHHEVTVSFEAATKKRKARVLYAAIYQIEEGTTKIYCETIGRVTSQLRWQFSWKFPEEELQKDRKFYIQVAERNRDHTLKIFQKKGKIEELRNRTITFEQGNSFRGARGTS